MKNRSLEFLKAYADITSTNRKICNLNIEAEMLEEHGKTDEANSRRALALKFKSDLCKQYDSKMFDLTATA